MNRQNSPRQKLEKRNRFTHYYRYGKLMISSNRTRHNKNDDIKSTTSKSTPKIKDRDEKKKGVQNKGLENHNSKPMLAGNDRQKRNNLLSMPREEKTPENITINIEIGYINIQIMMPNKTNNQK